VSTTPRERAIEAHHTLLNGSGELAYFEQRRFAEETLRQAHVGFEAGAFTYPCVAKNGQLLGIHYKTKSRNAKGKRRQWWEGYAEDLPPKGHGEKPDSPAKVIPFGLETLEDLEAGSLVVLCCGEEDALSLRQTGYVAVSQPGAGLLEPVYAQEFVGLEVVVFYDAGEEQKARKDALKLEQAGAEIVRVAEWPQDAPHGTDINGRLVEAPEGFEGWTDKMIAQAKPLHSFAAPKSPSRKGEPDEYATAPVPEPPSWPMLPKEAFYGLPGEIVESIEPHTEADPVALLTNLLGSFGNAIDQGAYFRVGPTLHHLKIFAALVGQTSKARKGTSWDPIKELFYEVDHTWATGRVVSGLSSGEGVIHAVRDPVYGKDKRGEEVVLDEGEPDKRLMVLEGEMAGALKVMGREGNTLSVVLREAWDGDRLRTLTKNSPTKATGAHISVLGHITKEELLRHLTETEQANGFANRFVWLVVRRSKELPFGGKWHEMDKASLVERLRSAIEFGKHVGEIKWGESAKGAWREVYGPLSEGKPGLYGAVVGRAEAQVVRLASLYAVLDESSRIELGHLEAALALWEYAEESARYIFGDATGDPVADQIVEALRAAGKAGLTRTEIRDMFKRHKSADHLNQALALLLRGGRVYRRSENTGGRPTERWFLQ